MELRLDEPTGGIREISWPLYQSKGWIKFIGILSIIQGAVLALTLFGLVIAWLPIWIGILLMQCASSIDKSRTNGDKAQLILGLDKLRVYFTIKGILTLLILLILPIAFAMGVLGGIYGVLSGLR